MSLDTYVNAIFYAHRVTVSLQTGENSSPIKFIPASPCEELEIPAIFTQPPFSENPSQPFNFPLIKM
jgi:hypothetical protein